MKLCSELICLVCLLTVAAKRVCAETIAFSTTVYTDPHEDVPTVTGTLQVSFDVNGPPVIYDPITNCSLTLSLSDGTFVSESGETGLVQPSFGDPSIENFDLGSGPPNGVFGFSTDFTGDGPVLDDGYSGPSFVNYGLTYDLNDGEAHVVTPEPASWLLLLTGSLAMVLGWAGLRRRGERQAGGRTDRAVVLPGDAREAAVA